MELKVGQTIYAKDVCLTDKGKHSLIVGKGYIVDSAEDEMFRIQSEHVEYHFFDNVDFDKYFTTEPPKKERYFIVFYFFVDKEKNGHGFCGIVTNDGGYLNRDETLKEIKEQNEQAVLTNIIELNQQDYESWNK